MEIRPIGSEDIPAYQHIASQSFARGEPVEFKPEEFLPPDRYRLGAFEGGRLQAQYTIADFELYFKADKRPCGGIASVACEPSARGRGYAGALIDRSLEVMRDRGQYLSLLWPFDQRYYRQFGWDWTAYDRCYTVPLRLLETSPEAEYIEPLFDDHFAVLNPIYEAKASQYHGPLVRSEKRWEYLLKPRDKRQAATYVYRRDGQSEGLAVIRYTEKRDRARVSEFVALTPRAYRAFLTLFKRHAATVEKFEWYAPPDDILWSLINHWDVKTKIEPAGMGRIVDLQAALQALSPATDLSGRVVVRVVDPHAPWNEGTWQIEVEDGKVSMGRTQVLPGVTADIQAFTQAYWGTPSLADVRRAGRIDVEKEGAFDLLSRLLPATPVWLADDF